MQPIAISYIITTKNKLPYLKNRLEKLFAQKSNDEEILIADGDSADGTKEYLAELKQAGKIDFYLSEPDHGEAHALNKLFLIAGGTLIKVITDDDIFHYPAIKACKNFMLAQPQIDMMSTNGGFKNQNPGDDVRPLTYERSYRQWQKNYTPFSFCGLGTMIRKSSLPLLGLWDPLFRAADAEFSFRTTAGKANVAWYTGYSFVNVSNPQSVSLVYKDKIKNEIDRLNKFYLNKNPDLFIVEKIKVLRNKFRSWFLFGNKNKLPPLEFQAQWPNLAVIAEKWLEIKNKEKKPEFLWNTKK